MAAAKKFSERMGYTPVPEELLTKDISRELRARLWNAIYELLHPYGVLAWELCELIADEFFKAPVDDMCKGDFVAFLKEEFFSFKWYEVYDFLEFLVRKVKFEPQLARRLKVNPHIFTTKLNRILEEERSSYRIIDAEIMPISSDVDKLAVEQALEKTESRAIFENAHNHIQKALALFSNRESPDYENTIKESISAIEAVARALTGKENATLKEAIDLLREKLKLHPALVEAINRLYGYASDESGIRHAGKPGRPGPTQAEARLVLVLASGIVGYLIDLSRDDF